MGMTGVAAFLKKLNGVAFWTVGMLIPHIFLALDSSVFAYFCGARDITDPAERAVFIGLVMFNFMKVFRERTGVHCFYVVLELPGGSAAKSAAFMARGDKRADAALSVDTPDKEEGVRVRTRFKNISNSLTFQTILDLAATDVPPDGCKPFCLARHDAAAEADPALRRLRHDVAAANRAFGLPPGTLTGGALAGNDADLCMEGGLIVLLQGSGFPVHFIDMDAVLAQLRISMQTFQALCMGRQSDVWPQKGQPLPGATLQVMLRAAAEALPPGAEADAIPMAEKVVRLMDWLVQNMKGFEDYNTPLHRALLLRTLLFLYRRQLFGDGETGHYSVEPDDALYDGVGNLINGADVRIRESSLLPQPMDPEQVKLRLAGQLMPDRGADGSTVWRSWTLAEQASVSSAVVAQLLLAAIARLAAWRECTGRDPDDLLCDDSDEADAEPIDDLVIMANDLVHGIAVPILKELGWKYSRCLPTQGSTLKYLPWPLVRAMIRAYRPDGNLEAARAALSSFDDTFFVSAEELGRFDACLTYAEIAALPLFAEAAMAVGGINAKSTLGLINDIDLANEVVSRLGVDYEAGLALLRQLVDAGRRLLSVRDESVLPLKVPGLSSLDLRLDDSRLGPLRDYANARPGALGGLTNAIIFERLSLRGLRWIQDAILAFEAGDARDALNHLIAGGLDGSRTAFFRGETAEVLSAPGGLVEQLFAAVGLGGTIELRSCFKNTSRYYDSITPALAAFHDDLSVPYEQRVQRAKEILGIDAESLADGAASAAMLEKYPQELLLKAAASGGPFGKLLIALGGVNPSPAAALRSGERTVSYDTARSALACVVNIDKPTEAELTAVRIVLAKLFPDKENDPPADAGRPKRNKRCN